MIFERSEASSEEKVDKDLRTCKNLNFVASLNLTCEVKSWEASSSFKFKHASFELKRERFESKDACFWAWNYAPFESNVQRLIQNHAKIESQTLQRLSQNLAKIESEHAKIDEFEEKRDEEDDFKELTS